MRIRPYKTAKKPHILLVLKILLVVSGCCDQSAIPELERKLYSPQAKDRNEAALGLAHCGERAEMAVSRLATMLYDENVGVQSSAAYALRKIDTEKARQVLEQAEERRRRRR